MGALEVQVYGGADAQFTLTEDDGETIAYEESKAIRTTVFEWDDASKTLSWRVQNADLELPHAFKAFFVRLFDSSNNGKESDILVMSTGGQISMGQDQLLV